MWFTFVHILKIYLSELDYSMKMVFKDVLCLCFNPFQEAKYDTTSIHQNFAVVLSKMLFLCCLFGE